MNSSHLASKGHRRRPVIIGFAVLAAVVLGIVAPKWFAPTPSETVTEASSPTAKATDPEAAPLTQAAVVFPIEPGQTGNWEQALTKLMGPRYNDYETSRARYGVTQQTTILQRTPMGDFAVIYFQGPDLDKTTQTMASSEDPWDVDWRKLTSGLHGKDFGNAANLKIDVHLVADTGTLTAGQKKDTKPFGFLVPLDPTNAQTIRARFTKLMSEQRNDYLESRRTAGIVEEKIFLENTAVGPALVVYWEANDPTSALTKLSTSNFPFDKTFRDTFDTDHAVPSNVLANIVATNRVIADYPHRK